jgi:hypothetical protein
MLAASPSHAHRISTRSGPPPEGVSIPSLTHGQMAVIRDNLPAIRALASARLGFDITTWRLEDYLNLQSFACLWGIAPGSITDEESPSHGWQSWGLQGFGWGCVPSVRTSKIKPPDRLRSRG